MEWAYFVLLPPWPIVSHQRVVQFLFNTSSLSSDAQETRQRDGFWKDSRGGVAKALNDEDNIMQDLSALPELDLTDY